MATIVFFCSVRKMLCTKREAGQPAEQNNKKSKHLNNPYLSYLQDFFAVISLTQSTIANGYLRPLTTELLHKF